MWKSTRHLFAALLLIVGAFVVGVGDGESASARRAEAPADSPAREAARQFAAGNYFTCLLSSNGTIRCWGDNTYGQLGNGQTNSNGETSSVGVLGITNAVEVVAGAYHACALLSDTRVKCWGYGLFGQLGHGGVNSAANRSTPVFVKDSDGVSDLSGVATIAAGYGHTCAVFASGGSVKCWGSPGSGALGNGVSSGASADWTPLPQVTKIDASTPLTGVTDLIAGASGFGACALLSSGRMRCWGSNSSGQLGNGSQTSAAYADTEFSTSTGVLTGVTGMTAGSNHFCGITSTALYCAGGTMNRYAFGLQTPQSYAVPYFKSAIRQAAGSGDATCFVTDGAVVQCAGALARDSGASTFAGAGGSGAAPLSSFSELSGLSGVTGIVSGWAHFCAITSTALKCWGLNNYGQLGATTADSMSTPVDVLSLQPTTVTLSDPGAKNVDSPAFEITATASSGVTPVLSIDSGSTARCSVTGNTVTILDSGACVVAAVSGSSGMYASGAATRTINIAPLAPVVTNGAVSGLTMSGATLASSVNAKGASTTVVLEYAASESLVASTSVNIATTPTGIAATAVSGEVTGLAPGATYFYRFVATNSVGTTRGAIASFTTKGSKPTAVTGSATRSAAGMTVNGKVNPKELETSVRFEYGTDPKLVGAQQTAARTQTGAEEVDLSAAITGLAENTTYYYRIVASNVVGSAEGDIRSFTTSRPEGVSINDGDEFTSSQDVVVSVVGPSTAVKAILSNDGGFKTSETFDLVNNSADIKWKLQSSREGTFTKIVYVKFVSRFGSQSQAVTDDIILDTTKPVVSTVTAAAVAPTGNAVQVARISASRSKRAGGVRLSLRGSDTISGVGSIEVRSAASKPVTQVKVSRVAGKADGKPRAASQTINLRTTAKRLQVRVVDRAGNASAWRTIVVR